MSLLKRSILGSMIVVGGASGQIFAAISSSDLVVLQQNNTAVPSNNNGGIPINLVEVTTGGTIVQTLAVPTSSLVTDTAPSEGDLSLSANGTLLTFTGYTGGVVSNETNVLTRAVGAYDSTGTFSLPTGANYNNSTAGTQTRGAYSSDGVNFYMTDKSGIFDNGGSAILTGSSNTRSIKSFGGSTYILQAASGTPVISLLAPGSPSTATTSVTTTGITPTAGDSNALDFAMVSSGQNGSQFDTLYYTDNTGIFKYADVSGTWTAEGEITGATSHLSGITAAPDPVAGVDLYVTYTNGATNRLEEITDATAYNASATTSTPTINTLYTAPANDLLRGVSFGPVPVPEPVSISFVGVGVLGLLGRPRRKAVTT